MVQKQLVQSHWVERLSDSLQALVAYEQLLKSELLYLRHRGEMAFGMPGSTRSHSREHVQERVSVYSLLVPEEPYANSEYHQDVNQKLSELQEVLLEHLALERTASTGIGPSNGGPTDPLGPAF